MSTLTRHLYRFDEVMAACMFTLSMGRVREALFWTTELMCSGYAADAIYCMMYVWAFTIGPLRLEWARRAWEVFHHEEIQDTVILQYAQCLAVAIASRPDLGKGVTEETTFTNTKDSTALLLCLAGREKEDTTKQPTVFREFLSLKELDWKALETRAGADARMRQLLSAFQRMNACIGEEYADRLKRMLFAVGYLGCFQLKGEQKVASWRPIVLRNLDDDVTGWLKETVGLRKQDRVYQIPYMCLYGMTQRGNLSQKETNLEEIYNVEPILRTGGWWGERILEEYGGLIEDTDRERFYETEFPEDIPDEWPLADQLKSHGGGAAVAAGVAPNVARVLERWFPVERSVWISQGDARGLWKQLRELSDLEKRLGFTL